jgi:hypothetical protein
MNNLFVPERFAFAIGETFSPPAFLWQQVSCGCPPVIAPVDLTGCNAVFTARQSPFSAVPSILASTENGMISIAGIEGSIQLILPSWYTLGLLPFEGWWDLWIYYPYPTLAQYRLFGGGIDVYQAVGTP